ncbi:MAG: MarC family protein [Sulfolobaceae archaeon]|nr:MarC family protein [Sulfolobaceae archaeon]
MNLISIPIVAVKLFAIMDPFSVIPYIISIYTTYNESSQQKVTWNFIVNKIMIAVTVLLLIFAVIGRPLLDFLGLSPQALEIGGGILLLYLGIDTLGGFQQLKFIKRLDEAVVTPIATPLIVGPGTMTALITLAVNYNVIILIIGSLLAGVLTYITLFLGPFLIKVLGETGTVAAGRFTAVIIAAFGAQLILNGISVLIK